MNILLVFIGILILALVGIIVAIWRTTMSETAAQNELDGRPLITAAMRCDQWFNAE